MAWPQVQHDNRTGMNFDLIQNNETEELCLVVWYRGKKSELDYDTSCAMILPELPRPPDRKGQAQFIQNFLSKFVQTGVNEVMNRVLKEEQHACTNDQTEK